VLGAPTRVLWLLATFALMVQVRGGVLMWRGVRRRGRRARRSAKTGRREADGLPRGMK
jgi:uncharacterized iron-regulated membrane protein